MKKTLRFPRVTKVRIDKDISSILTVDELNEMNPKTLKCTDKQVIPLLNRKRETSETTYPKDGFLLNTHIYIANATNKRQIEEEIKMASGNLTANFIPNLTTLIIAEKIDLRLKNIIEKFDTDILLPSFIVDCLKAKYIIPQSPSYFLYISASTKAELADKFDIYGDSYTEQLSTQKYNDLLAKINTDVDFDVAYKELTKKQVYSFAKYFK